MPRSNAEIIRDLYGYNWVAVGDRERGLAAAAAVMASDLEARISPEVADRTLHGIGDFAVFVQGLEEDFSEFRYDGQRFEEVGPERVMVTGHIRARGRRSNMPLTAPFGHLWEMRDGKAVRVQARLLTETATV
jgi:ketosteroid isomerase-like protein